MPRSDDTNGLPPERLGRPQPRQRAPERSRPERSWPERSWEQRAGDDWRHPDPAERYARSHDGEEAPPARDPFADEWQSVPEADESFDFSDSFAGGAQDLDWSAHDDPFNWDASDPTSDPAWRPEPYSQNTPNREPAFSTHADPWADDEPFDDPRRNEPPRAAARDDNLFRRIDGSVQEPDLSALTERATHDADPFAGDPERDPAELGDRFFARTAEFDEAQAATPPEQPRANIFDLEQHRTDVRQTRLDDPYSWDSYDDEPDATAHEAVSAADDPYAEDYDPYDPYAENPHLHTEDDLDADFLDDEPDTYEHPATQPKRRRKLMVAGVLVAAVATGGAGAFVYKSYEDGSIGNGDAPTVMADDGPVKSKPSDPGGKEFPDSNKQIYDRLNGKPAKPVEEAQAGSDGETGSTAIPGIVTTGAEAPADTLDERIAAALRKSGAPAGSTQNAAPSNPNAPRSVRTLTVRPDGSVVTAQAGSRAAPDNQPDEGQAVTTAGIISTTGANTSEQVARTQTTDEPAANTTNAGTSDSQSSSDMQASLPTQRPERAEPRPRETQVASAEPATMSSTQPETTSANPYFVQIAARRDQTSALAAFADLQQKYPNVLNGLAPTIKRADLGDKGIWYRLWVGPMDTRNTAQDVCAQLKQSGLGGCFVRTE
jgi:cell division protein FtsN